jgi:hypothetical protein
MLSGRQLRTGRRTHVAPARGNEVVGDDVVERVLVERLAGRQTERGDPRTLVEIRIVADGNSAHVNLQVVHVDQLLEILAYLRAGHANSVQRVCKRLNLEELACM